ncbi:MAG TPA: hypothetical protein VFR55_03170 [Dehalococcoidia bacterium]|nr:hypothetical protein [Dehalococcoidia bacterium]
MFQIGKSWIYIGCAVLGALAPVGIFYLVNYDRRVPGSFIDLGLLLFSAGVSIIFLPLGLGAGLGLAILVHLAWNRVQAGWTWRR